MEPGPFFPLELERLIFEAAFDPDDLASNVNMTLVAQRVRQWIRPLLCRIIFQSSGSYAESFKPQFPNFKKHWRTCHLEDIGPFVKHILVQTYHAEYTGNPKYENTTAFVEDLLKHCPNIESLANWCQDGLSEEMISLVLGSSSKLRRYSDSPSTSDRPHSRDIWFSPGFKGLTHLDLMDCPADWPFEALASYTNLTHFSAVLPIAWQGSTLQSILDLRSTLKVFIIGISIRNVQDEILDVHRQMTRMVGDPRIVLMDAEVLHAKDWLEAAKGRFDSWTFAERVIEARKKQLFKPETNHWDVLTMPFDWETNLKPGGMQWYASWKQ